MDFRRKSIVLSAAVMLVFLFSFTARAKEAQKLPYQIIQTAELKALWDSKVKDLLVIDTRSPGEYADIHIPGAVNIPQKKFDAYKHLLPSEKSIRLVFYCNGIK